MNSFVIRNQLNCSFVNFHSNVLFVKSLKILRLIYVSNRQLLWLYKKHQKLISLAYLKIPICALFLLNVSPLCQRTFNLLVVFVENVPKLNQIIHIDKYFKILKIKRSFSRPLKIIMIKRKRTKLLLLKLISN